MMISNNYKEYQEAYVWIWLPEQTEPIVAGKLTTDGNSVLFNYGKSYLERKEAISIYDKELPLKSGILPLISGLTIANSIRDSAPDAWGRRVIINKILGLKNNNNNIDLNELTYLLESGSDRIGALDFQLSPTNYEPRLAKNATLTELLESAQRVEKGIPLTKELDQALHHGSSIGGARPKALIEDDGKKYIAKFSTSSDTYNLVKAEFIAMRLAKLSGLNVASVTLAKASDKDVLLIERFDRIKTQNKWERKIILSALTVLELDEMMARYASYENLAEIIRHRFTNAKSTLTELFSRIVFNILCGNTDDHARNHAAFWDGKTLTLTPAYDICPQRRSGGEASQAMLISNNNRMSKISSCLDAANIFFLSIEEAKTIIENQIDIINKNWKSVCDEAELNETDRNFLWKKQFLNPYLFED
jgi:serine/threonine-protein kinase HipA